MKFVGVTNKMVSRLLFLAIIWVIFMFLGILYLRIILYLLIGH